MHLSIETVLGGQVELNILVSNLNLSAASMETSNR